MPIVCRWSTAPILALALMGCGALDVNSPTAIEDSELNDAAGAELLRGDALKRFYIAFGQTARATGLMSDEFFSDPPAYYAIYGIVSDEELLDRRESLKYEQLGSSLYSFWQELRHAAAVALPKLRRYGNPAHLGEMYALRGFAALHLAEDFCPGFPLSDVVDYKVVYGPPLSTETAIERALADFDSALVGLGDSARVFNVASVGRARALLGLGRYVEAAAAVAAVPTDFVQTALTIEVNPGDYLGNTLVIPDRTGQLDKSVSNLEGGTGFDFVAAEDPRVVTAPVGLAADSATEMYSAVMYPDNHTPMVMASGVEARLIEAEAAFQAGGAWLGKLNALRAERMPSLPELDDPGNDGLRVDLIFRERAFWLFATAHRLGDLRRLIAQYGRTPDAVFPAGSYRLGGSYGAATSIPFPANQETPFNPAVTGCTSR